MQGHGGVVWRNVAPARLGVAGGLPDRTPRHLLPQLLFQLSKGCRQAVSSRPDVAPPSYTAELEKLQDQIPPFPSDEAMQVLEAELGCAASVHFFELSPQPVAAASLGQASAHMLAVSRGA